MGSKGLEAAMKVLIGVVFAGWMLIWFVLPTNLYRKNWSPKISADTTSTYFGSLGRNLLILAFPVFFIAVLGSVCLHLEQKRRRNTEYVQSGKKQHRLAYLKRPRLVRGPLGIVSSIELAFSVMFSALVIWHLAFFISLGFEGLQVIPGEQVWQAKLESAGLRIGLVGNLCLAFLFIPVTRWSSLLPLIGLTSESSVRYHVWMGHVTMVVFTAHGLCYVVYWASIDKICELIAWATTGASNLAGALSLLSGLIMWATTHPSIRRKSFELFFYTHQLYVLFLIFFGFHVGMGHFFWNLPGVYLFLLDRYLRFLQSRTNVRLLSARLLPTSFELTFSKSPGFDYTAMSSVFLNVPSISKLQWHPFTVSSSSGLEPENMSVVIKNEGKWTRRLHETLLSDPNHLQVSVEGPYGPITNGFLHYDNLVLVSGGSGVTPYLGMIRELLHMTTTTTTMSNDKVAVLPSVHLICAFKTSDDLKMLELLLPESATCDLSRLNNLRIDAYVTREDKMKPPSLLTRSISLKPRDCDSPIRPIFGPNGWLWLAAVVSCSFVAFLLLLGILTRYYFYPNEKNHGGGGSHSAHSPRTSTKAALTMLFMLLSVVVVGGIAVLWNKTIAGKEVKQVNNAVMTPKSSPSHTDVELESLPTESHVLQSANVHYGARPNLKEMLLGRKGKVATGVFVSGPSAMRREVAMICASGLAENLHFESVSFSW